eukprot:1146058-Rhodomonas_salina.4
MCKVCAEFVGAGAGRGQQWGGSGVASRCGVRAPTGACARALCVWCTRCTLVFSPCDAHLCVCDMCGAQGVFYVVRTRVCALCGTPTRVCAMPCPHACALCTASARGLCSVLSRAVYALRTRSIHRLRNLLLSSSHPLIIPSSHPLILCASTRGAEERWHTRAASDSAASCLFPPMLPAARGPVSVAMEAGGQ